jgi:hypothetical protein
MKKINIQRDVESRKNIARSIPPAAKIETIVEPVTQEKDAESEANQEQAVDTSPTDGKTKKRGRTAKGDTQEVPV